MLYSDYVPLDKVTRRLHHSQGTVDSLEWLPRHTTQQLLAHDGAGGRATCIQQLNRAIARQPEGLQGYLHVFSHSRGATLHSARKEHAQGMQCIAC
jgi:hypothetical protein